MLPVLLAVAFVLFATGIFRLFLLRFEAGDVYPAYSSLRSDPLGTRALFESYAGLPGITVVRNYLPFARIQPEQGLTLFVLGARPAEEVPEDVMESLARIAEKQGRIIIAFHSRHTGARRETIETCTDEEKPSADLEYDEDADKETASQGQNNADDSRASKKVEAGEVFYRTVSIPEALGIQYGYDNNQGMALRVISGSGTNNFLPSEISWHTGLYFKDLHEDWQVLYTSNDKAVVIEKDFSEGSIVMIADSYPFSNEALRNEDYAGFLAWSAGLNSRIVFEETHLGVRDQRGIAFLVKKYQLTWFTFGLLVIAALFIWKRSVSLVPPQQDHVSSAGFDFSAKQDYLQGLESLLQRNISQSDILAACFGEWQKSGTETAKDISSRQVDAVKKLLQRAADKEAGSLDQAGRYNEICKLISRDRP